jgi:signal peptidase I
MMMSVSSESVRVWADATNALIDASLQSGQAIRFTIKTASMLPTLRPGDQVIVRSTRPEQLRLGDIVLVQFGESRIAHRLIRWCSMDGAQYLVTKGDNSWVADQACSPAYLCGIIMLVQRGNHLVSLQSGWARSMNRWLAILSRGEKIVYHAQPGLFRRLALKCLRISLRLGVYFQFRITQEITA